MLRSDMCNTTQCRAEKLSQYSIANQTELAHETNIVFSTHLVQEALQIAYDRGSMYNDGRERTARSIAKRRVYIQAIHVVNEPRIHQKEDIKPH